LFGLFVDPSRTHTLGYRGELAKTDYRARCQKKTMPLGSRGGPQHRCRLAKTAAGSHGKRADGRLKEQQQNGPKRDNKKAIRSVWPISSLSP